MNKSLIVFCIMSAFSISVYAQKTVKISGNVQFTSPGFVVSVYQRSGAGKQVLAETVVDKDNNYSLKVKFPTPGQYTVDCGHWQSVNIWGEDENMTIDFRGLDTAKIKIKNPPFVYIKGGKKNEVMNLINYEIYRNYQSMIAISQSTYKNITNEEEKGAVTSALYNANNENFFEHLKYIVEHYGDTPSVLAAIKMLGGEKYADFKEKALVDLEARYPKYQPIKDYKEEVIQDRINKERMKIGNPAPLFSYPVPDGTKKVGPADFKGKILLIDFWASWCGPCRGEIPNLKEVYAKFKDRGVEILSVSIDDKRNKWEEAMADEKMPWTQILADNAGKELMEQYQFSGIPFIVLIDRDGNLAAKFLRGPEIEKAITELLEKDK